MLWNCIGIVSNRPGEIVVAGSHVRTTFWRYFSLKCDIDVSEAKQLFIWQWQLLIYYRSRSDLYTFRCRLWTSHWDFSRLWRRIQASWSLSWSWAGLFRCVNALYCDSFVDLFQQMHWNQFRPKLHFDRFSSPSVVEPINSRFLKDLGSVKLLVHIPISHAMRKGLTNG